MTADGARLTDEQLDPHNCARMLGLSPHPSDDPSHFAGEGDEKP